jgi:G3E family GTPase
MTDGRIAVSIITGFLGSGKTTLLNRLLQHDALSNSLVIINEFGAVGIDHLLVSTPVENVRLLANGCLCCEVRGDLVDTLTDVAQKRSRGEISAFDRILVETTGLADPVPIIQTIVADAELARIFRLDAVVGVVDAVHALGQIASQDEARKQIAVADVLLVSKTDLVPAGALSEVEHAVRSINAGTELIAVVRGEVDPERLFGRGRATASVHAAEVERWIGANARAASALGRANRRSPHAGDIRTFTLFHDTPVSVTGLTTWLTMLAGFKGPQLLRLKGIVNVEGDPYVLHAVQTVIHEAVRLEAWPSEDRRTRIVFIGRGLDRDAIERSFSAFAMPEPVAAAPHIDPAAYARFLEAAKQFT